MTAMNACRARGFPFTRVLHCCDVGNLPLAVGLQGCIVQAAACCCMDAALLPETSACSGQAGAGRVGRRLKRECGHAAALPTGLGIGVSCRGWAACSAQPACCARLACCLAADCPHCPASKPQLLTKFSPDHENLLSCRALFAFPDKQGAVITMYLL